MRLVEIKLKCGWPECTTVATEGDGVVITRSLTVDGHAAEIDICKSHSEDLDELLAPLVADGRPVTVAPKRKNTKKKTVEEKTVEEADDLTCKVDGCGRSFSKVAGLAQHVIRTNDHRRFENLAIYREHYPPSTPSTG